MIVKCNKKDVETTLEKLIAPHICGTFDMKRTANGKPYIEGDPVCFSIAHSGERAVIAVSDHPVGVDCEAVKPRKFSSVLSRFSERERAEICGDFQKFLYFWTAKEAFIKMRGGTLARDLKRIELVGGRLYFNGEPQDCTVEHMNDGELIIAICERKPARF